MRRKWPHTREKTHRAGKIASIRGKKPHVYYVITLKQMADHRFQSARAKNPCLVSEAWLGFSAQANELKNPCNRYQFFQPELKKER